MSRIVNALFVFTLLALFLSPALSRADDVAPVSKFGGCFKSGKICLGPSGTLTVTAINFTKSTIEPAFTPGLGYGVTFNAGAWYMFGADLYGAIDPIHQIASATLMFKAANYLRFGISKGFIGDHDWRLPIGFGTEF